MTRTGRPLRAMFARRLLTSSGARANAAQGLQDVRRDRSDRAAAAAAVDETATVACFGDGTGQAHPPGQTPTWP